MLHERRTAELLENSNGSMRRGEPQVRHPWIRRKFVMSCAEIGEHADKADFSESKGDDGDDGAGAANTGAPPGPDRAPALVSGSEARQPGPGSGLPN